MLSSRDYHAILGIIECLYAAPTKATLFQTLWEQLDRLIGISSAVWLPIDPQTRHFLFKDHVLYQSSIPPAFLFTAYYAPLHPLVQRGVLSQGMAAHKITDALSACRLSDTEYGCDFQPLTPLFYELCSVPCAQGEVLGGMGLHRQRGDRDFTERHREILNALLPHLSRALHALDLREALTAAADAGLIVIGADGRPTLINDEARRALHGRPVETIPDPGLGADPAVWQTEAGVYGIRTLPVRMGSREKIIVLEPQPTDRAVAPKLAEYGLTRREQEIATWVIRGLSNREIAERLFICEQTVKDHLHDVFEKMKLVRRTELAAKLLLPSARGAASHNETKEF